MQPHDQRLATALDYVGSLYAMQDPAAAEAAFQQELKVTEDLYGPSSPNLTGPLQALCQLALMHRDFAKAEKLAFRAVDLNEKTYGEASEPVAHTLFMAANVSAMQGDFAKSGALYLRSMSIYETIYGHDSPNLMQPLPMSAVFYEKWEKPEKAEHFNRQLIAVLEKQFGQAAPCPALESEARALRGMGRVKEAGDRGRPHGDDPHRDDANALSMSADPDAIF